MNINNYKEHAIKLAQQYHFEKNHAFQVTKIALALFDELEPLHGLSDTAKTFLESASILHDIGWQQGQKKHHKTSRDMIIASDNFSKSQDVKVIVALIARYHRKSLPKRKHKYFCDLSPQKQEFVEKLSSVLRIADGLDRSHGNIVCSLSCCIHAQSVIVTLSTKQDAASEVRAAMEKADLFEKIFKRKVVIRVR